MLLINVLICGILYVYYMGCVNMDMNKTNRFKNTYDDSIGEENLKNGMKLPHDREVNVRDEVKSKVRFVLFVVLTGLIASVGLSFFAQALAYKNQTVLKGKGDNGSGEKWDIAFVDMKLVSKKGNAEEKSAPTFSDTKASFNVTLNEPGDEIKYSLTIANRGSLNAILNNIIITPENKDNDEILYFVDDIKVYDYLDVGNRTEMTVTVKYNSNARADRLVNKSAEIVLNYIQR